MTSKALSVSSTQIPVTLPFNPIILQRKPFELEQDSRALTPTEFGPFVTPVLVVWPLLSEEYVVTKASTSLAATRTAGPLHVDCP
jgi:hypothetical protein